jgi:ferredoxin-NADP reductase/Na+-translocating ferredoxin:NAD+ oxidoreductase RnfD subunit
MIDYIDNFLNSITMYRLMLYYLIALSASAVLLSIFGILPFSPIFLLISVLFLVAISWAANSVLSYAFKAPTNLESVYITALILSLIITPASSPDGLIFLGWAGILAMASKYILAINKKLIFNPAAIAVAITSIAIGKSASWWVGSSSMLPFVILGGVLIVRKIRRTDMVLSFLAVALATIGEQIILRGESLTLLKNVLVDSPILFFSFVMLTEPLTTPPTKNLRIIYASIIGFIFSPQFHIANFYSTPELSLVLGNIFSFLVSSKERLILKLKKRIQIAPNIYDFVFYKNKKITYEPGQYMEWTLGQKKPDSRGSRRYLTLASSPSEDTLQIGIKFAEKSSSFKNTLLSLKNEDEIIASQLAGEFTLPKNSNEKYVFIAGGIGITPFRSIIKFLTDTNQKKSITLFYTVSTPQEIVYKDIFEKAKEKIGLKVIYKVGRIDNIKLIEEEVADFKERKFYISGPNAMVKAYKEMLLESGIKRKNIVTDYFPGY